MEAIMEMLVNNEIVNVKIGSKKGIVSFDRRESNLSRDFDLRIETQGEVAMLFGDITLKETARLLTVHQVVSA